MMTLVMMHVTSETPSKSSCLAEVYAEHYRMTLFCFAIKFDFFFFLEKLLVLLRFFSQT